MAVRRQEHGDDHTEGTENDTDIRLEISPEIQRRIQKAAIRNNLSINEYLEQTFPVETDSNEQQGSITSETVGRLRQLREQILQDRQGKPFEDSTEMIRQMREERTNYLENLLGE